MAQKRHLFRTAIFGLRSIPHASVGRPFPSKIMTRSIYAIVGGGEAGLIGRSPSNRTEQNRTEHALLCVVNFPCRVCVPSLSWQMVCVPSLSWQMVCVPSLSWQMVSCHVTRKTSEASLRVCVCVCVFSFLSAPGKEGVGFSTSVFIASEISTRPRYAEPASYPRFMRSAGVLPSSFGGPPLPPMAPPVRLPKTPLIAAPVCPALSCSGGAP
jgi:hypothetical protein